MKNNGAMKKADGRTLRGVDGQVTAAEGLYSLDPWVKLKPQEIFQRTGVIPARRWQWIQQHNN